MYEGLREAIRAATKVELVSWVEAPTDEAVLVVQRYGKRLWTQKCARSALVEIRAVEYIYNEQVKTANAIVDAILENVDWDTFY